MKKNFLIQGEISDELLVKLKCELPGPGEELTLEIDSPGGNLQTALKIYDLLRSSDINTCAIVVGDCMSAATVILLAARRRIAYPSARFLIHKPYIGYWGDSLTMEAADQVSRDIKKQSVKLRSIYQERTSASEGVLKSLMDHEQIFDATTAKNIGFIDNTITYLNVMKIKELKNLTVVAEDGTELTVEGEDIVVGAPVSGPDGVFSLPDGRVVLVEAGKISEVSTGEEEEKAPEEEEKAPEEEEKAPEEEEKAPEEEEKEKDLVNEEDIKLKEVENRLTSLEDQLKTINENLAKLIETKEEAADIVNRLRNIKTLDAAVKKVAPVESKKSMTIDKITKLVNLK